MKDNSKQQIYLHVDRDVPFPDPEGFVVGGGNESSIFVDEGDRVDGPQVTVVLLNNFVGPEMRILWHFSRANAF